MFAPSNAAFTSALLSGQLWQQLLPDAMAAAATDGNEAAAGGGRQRTAAMQRLLLDHLALGRLTVADLQQRLDAATANARSHGSSNNSSSNATAGPYITMASGRRALLTEREGA